MIGALVFLSLLSPADFAYWRGMALARAGQWRAAAAELERGEREAPRDKRFPIELAGVEFKQKRYAAAAASLRRALGLDPADAYANDFLATVYFLEGNVEAALERWNRIGKPQLERLRVEPEPRVDPQLLGSAFAFSPASTLKAEEYRETVARLNLLDVFPQWRLSLEPREEGGGFDAVLRTAGMRSWLAALRGLPFETVYPELRNAGGRGINVSALVRWDKQKRRAGFAVSGPVARNAGRRWRAWADGRNENWLVPSLAGFNLKRTAAGLDLLSAEHGWRWRVGAEVSHRRFWNAAFLGGSALSVRAAADRDVLRFPERRFTVSAHASTELGRFFGRGAFSKSLAGMEARWLPRASGDDYEIRGRLRAGAIAGAAPFDELYLLGIERDTDLWLRGHPATSGGRKGSGPLGREFALLNWEVDKVVRRGGFYTLKLAPFLDGGRAFGPGRFGPSGWLWDTGLELKLRLAGGVGVAFVWGRPLNGGGNAFYALPLR